MREVNRLGITQLKGSNWKPRNTSLLTEQICYAAPKTEDSVGVPRQLGCCLIAGTEKPISVVSLGLLLNTVSC